MSTPISASPSTVSDLATSNSFSGFYSTIDSTAISTPFLTDLPTSATHATSSLVPSSLATQSATSVSSTLLSDSMTIVFSSSELLPISSAATSMFPSQSALSPTTLTIIPSSSASSVVYRPVYPPTTKGTVSPPTIAPSCTGTGSGCCKHALQQLPASIEFMESDIAGTMLAAMRDVANIRISVTIHKPAHIQSFLSGAYNITRSGNTYSLMLTKSIDLEELYKKAGDDPTVGEMQVKLDCRDVLYPAHVETRYVRVTILDVDDTMPRFQHPDAHSDCVIPIYSADTSEDYTGELSLSPGTIRAVDGDISSQHNVSYTVMHSEPEDYHVYFDLDTETGIVNKTRRISASVRDKYIIFVKASEDSPEQKSRVAVLSIVVVAPSDPSLEGQVRVNATAVLTLQIASALVMMAFMCGVIVLIHHRYRLKHRKIRASREDDMQGEQMSVPKVTIYPASSTMYQKPHAALDVPSITSPSQIAIGGSGAFLEVPPYSDTPTSIYSQSSGSNSRRGSVNSTTSQKKRVVIIKKPLDTHLRPGWNAPPPRAKRLTYNPFSTLSRK